MHACMLSSLAKDTCTVLPSTCILTFLACWYADILKDCCVGAVMDQECVICEGVD